MGDIASFSTISSSFGSSFSVAALFSVDLSTGLCGLAIGENSFCTFSSFARIGGPAFELSCSPSELYAKIFSGEFASFSLEVDGDGERDLLGEDIFSPRRRAISVLLGLADLLSIGDIISRSSAMTSFRPTLSRHSELACLLLYLRRPPKIC